MKQLIYFFICVSLFISCKKNDDPFVENNHAPLAIKFDNVAGEEDLKISTGSYTNAQGETFTVSSLQYFISNIQLKKTNGEAYVVPQDSSYFLINETTGETRPIIRVPEGEYGSLSFMIGVDSLRSTMDLSRRTGVLAPTANNYWNENQGYIFFRMEGNSPQAENGKYRLHIGGYGGKTTPTFNNIKTVNIDLTAAGVAKVHTGDTASIHLMVDILQVFDGHTNIRLADDPEILFDDNSVEVAENLEHLFTHDHTHN